MFYDWVWYSGYFMFGFWVSFDTQYVIWLSLILMMFYVWFSSIVWYSVCFMIEFAIHDVLCLVLEYRLILSIFYLFVSRYHLILDMFYVMFQGYRFGVFMIIVYKATGSLTSVFKTCYSLDLERADFDRQSFQYTWLNSYFFSSLQESRLNILSY